MTSTSLLAGVRAHDEAAWRQMVDLYGPLVYSWCRGSGASPEDAKDLVQQVFAKVLRGIHGFRKESATDTFRGWLRTIAQNAICDHARSRKRGVLAAGGTEALQRMQAYPDRDPAPSTTTLNGGHSDLALRALDLIRNEFPLRAMQAFQLTVLDGLNATEAAQQLQSTPESVRKAKSRILRRLREVLGDAE